VKIAHVITRMIVGGAQENTLLNCLDLAERHDDDVLLITGPALGPEGDLLTRADRIPFEVEFIDAIRRPIHPLRDLAAYREVKRTLKRFQPDVVHTHSAKGGVLGRLAASATGVPAIVHTVHGAPFYPYQSLPVRTLYRWIETYAASRCHRMICVADAMTDLMVAGRVAKREKFTTIYSGMDVAPFIECDQFREETRARLGFNSEHIVVGKISRLFELKGHEFVIAAARTIVDSNPNVRFLFVGDGILRGRLEEQIREANLEPHFVFAGLVDPSEIPEMISAMDMLVHMSLREGLARALPQALLAGKPAISFDIDGAREVVIDGSTGRLLAPRDTSGLADAVIGLADDPALRQSMGEEGRSRFAEQFSREHMTESIREVYEDILNPETLTNGGADD